MKTAKSFSFCLSFSLSAFVYIPCFLMYLLCSNRRVIFANQDSIFKINICKSPPKLLTVIGSFHELRDNYVFSWAQRSQVKSGGLNPTFQLYFYSNHRMVYDVTVPNCKGKKYLCFILFVWFPVHSSSSHLVTGTQLWKDTLIAVLSSLAHQFSKNTIPFYKNAKFWLWELLLIRYG